MEKPFQLIKILYESQEYLALIKQSQKVKAKQYYYFINKKYLLPNAFTPIRINAELRTVEPRLSDDEIVKPDIKDYMRYAQYIKKENLTLLKINPIKLP